MFSDLPEKVRYFFEPMQLEEKAALKLEEGRAHLAAMLPLLETADWTHDALESVLKSYAETAGAKLGAVMQPLRAATTGRLETPGMYEVLLILGRERVLERLRAAVL